MYVRTSTTLFSFAKRKGGKGQLKLSSVDDAWTYIPGSSVNYLVYLFIFQDRIHEV